MKNEVHANTMDFHINQTRFMQTWRIFITFRTFRTKKRNPTLNLSYGGDRRPLSFVFCIGDHVLHLPSP